MAADLTTFPITTSKLSELIAIGAIDALDVLYVLDVSTGLSHKVTVADILSLAPGGGNTDLAIANNTATALDVTSSTGTDATLPISTAVLAGLMSAADKVKADFISITQAVDLDTMESDITTNAVDITNIEAITNFITITQPVNLDTMESDITTNAVDITNIELKTDFISITQPVDLDLMEADVADLTTLSGMGSNSTDLGIFTGNIIADNETVKGALQDLEDNAGLNKFNATVAPVATDDSGAGYSVGSVWVDFTNGKAYTCLDATAAAAIWTETTVDADDQSASGYFDIGDMRIQWGSQSAAVNTVTLPAPFLNATDYSVNVTSVNGRYGHADMHTATTFRNLVTSSTGSSVAADSRWIAIGIKA